MSIGEFELIRRYFQRPSPSAVLGVGDDCALLQPTPGRLLAVSTDTLVAGRHFFDDVDPHALGWKSLAVNLSDLAAMGAQPRWFTLCLTLPQSDADWLKRFSAGLFALAERYGIELVGGDTTSGPLAISIQVMGEVAPGQALRRDAAQPGDDVWLSGPTGAAALAVAQRYGKLQLCDEDAALCGQKLDYPVPQVELGLALAGLAHAAIDISDGLLADLSHIATRSQRTIQVQQAALPQAALSASCLQSTAYQQAQCSGGDDYELAFTAAAAQRSAIEAIAKQLALPLQRIGCVHAGPAQMQLLDAAGQSITPSSLGFDHFPV